MQVAQIANRREPPSWVAAPAHGAYGYHLGSARSAFPTRSISTAKQPAWAMKLHRRRSYIEPFIGSVPARAASVARREVKEED
eukprot:scaffold67508_cov74-Phaeocystis_antarctica.AAC.1